MGQRKLMTPPKVSIVTPLFNKAEFFAETAESVFSQTMPDFEWIVIDDNSTDESAAILSELDDSRLQKRVNPTNQGPCASRNTGLDIARGEWLLFLDADDRIEEKHLENLLAASSNHDVVAGGWVEKNVECTDEGEMKSPPCQSNELAIAFAPWAIHAALIKKDACPRWAEELDRHLAEDIHFWFLALFGKKIGFVDSHSAIYRKNTPENRSSERNIAPWYEGVNAAVEANLSILQEAPTSKQAEVIMRLHEAFWLRARRAGNTEVEKAAGASAQKWLRAIKTQWGKISPSILARKILGIPMFHFVLRSSTI